MNFHNKCVDVYAYICIERKTAANIYFAVPFYYERSLVLVT